MLRRKGHLFAADTLAEKINHIIHKVQSQSLSDVTPRSTRKLWAAVHSKFRDDTCTNPKSVNADRLNEFFTNVSTGTPVDPGVYRSSASHCSSDVSEYDIEIILRQTRHTSSACDGLPSWLFRKSSVELTSVVTHIVNFSINLGQIPDMWRTAIVTPVPNVAHPYHCVDFRPISVTPILSRITEGLIVRIWLRPSIPLEFLSNQYGFRPTGSTTAALVHLFQCHRYPRNLWLCKSCSDRFSQGF